MNKINSYKNMYYTILFYNFLKWNKIFWLNLKPYIES